MSLKSIELQIAIPKTFEAGKITEQKQQQSMLNNEQAMTLVDKQLQKQRSAVMDSAESEKAKNKKSASEHEQNDAQDHPTDENEKIDIHVNHPYKGGFVDYTG